MAYVIGTECIDIMDRSCIAECPVDCIYEGNRKLYIHPTECIDCGACEVACPSEAIRSARIADPADRADNKAFFEQTLPGKEAPLGTPGGAQRTGVIGADTLTVTARPPAE
ncbi:MAG TPA: ferredoxin family protein [Pseudonocardiaceae bacterium]|nr:ferredoxin family protein [Pseudonocardiaceae bacterium]